MDSNDLSYRVFIFDGDDDSWDISEKYWLYLIAPKSLRKGGSNFFNKKSTLQITQRKTTRFSAQCDDEEKHEKWFSIKASHGCDVCVEGK